MSSSSSRWSASPPTGLVQPAWKAPQVASSSTSDGVRPQRPISRIDCWANTGLIAAPTVVQCSDVAGGGQPEPVAEAGRGVQAEAGGRQPGQRRPQCPRVLRGGLRHQTVARRRPPPPLPSKPRSADSSEHDGDEPLAPVGGPFQPVGAALVRDLRLRVGAVSQREAAAVPGSSDRALMVSRYRSRPANAYVTG